MKPKSLSLSRMKTVTLGRYLSQAQFFFKLKIFVILIPIPSQKLCTASQLLLLCLDFNCNLLLLKNINLLNFFYKNDFHF